MKVNELRIGNLVKELCLTDPYKDITGVDISRMWKNPNSELFNPIPLTEEWLIKFGCDNLGEFGYGIGEFHMESTHRMSYNFESKYVFRKYYLFPL